jgi:capsular exopolysaccharide synthesis family protein
MHESHSSQTFRDTIVTLARKWRIFVPFALVTPLVVFVMISSQRPMYGASADVLLNRQAFVLSDLRDATFWYPNREQLTQARLARLPEVGQRVVDAAGLQARGRYGFLAQSSVAAGGGTDVMTFHVSDPDPALAARLATTYAEQYISYRTEVDTRSLNRALAVVGKELEQARAGDLDPVLYADLVDKQQALNTALASLSTNATLVRRATTATQIAPRPRDSVLTALGLGLVVGIGLAGLAILLDPRGRTPEEIAEGLGLPLVGLLPREQRRSRAGKLALPRIDGPRAEAVHSIRTSLDALGSREGVVLVSSSVDGEGKSATAADLARAYAQAGRRVMLVDLDLARPTLARRFGVPPSPGLVNVVQGTARLGEAVQVVPLDRSTTGTLGVVTAGTPLATDTAGITAAPALGEALESLRTAADIVLVDTPPLLERSDALVLSAHADGVLLVLQARRYRRRYGPELRRLLARSRAAPLGVVIIAGPGELATARGGLPRDPYPDRHIQAFGRV